MDFIISFCQCFFGSQAIGAEYGEGFETFRLDGPLKVDVVRFYIIEFDFFRR